MRRNMTAVILAISMVLVLLPAPTTNALPRQMVIYTIYYNCICGLCPTGQVIGEWTRSCDGSWSGWGQSPDTVDGWCITADVEYVDC